MRDTFEDWPLLQTSLCKAISGRSARLQTSGTSTTSFGSHHFTSVAREILRVLAHHLSGLFGLTLRRCRVPLTLLTFSFASGGKLAWL